MLSNGSDIFEDELYREGLDTRAHLEIAAVAIEDDEGRVLVARRRAGAHLAGLYELPGGKVRPGETPEAAAAREAREELGVEVEVGRRLVPPVDHEYPDRAVRLHFFAARLRPGSPAPRPLGSAEVRWVARALLRELPFPAANASATEALLREPGPGPGPDQRRSTK